MNEVEPNGSVVSALSSAAYGPEAALTLLEPLATSEHGGAPTSRVAVSDMSEQKQMEAKAKLDAQLRQAGPRPRVCPKPWRRKGGKAREGAARR